MKHPRQQKSRPKRRPLSGAVPQMRVERIGVASLTSDPRNARLHGEQNLAAIAGSLRRFGQQKPIVVDAGGVVIAGNGTLAGAKQLGWTHVDAVRTKLTGDDARAFAIADNRTAELAEWDLAELQRQTDELAGSIDLADIGFADGQLDDILAGLRGETPGGEAAGEGGGTGPEQDAAGSGGAAGGDYDAQYKVIITCKDEDHQAELIAEFEGRGLAFTTPNVG
jgi:ParB-like chromosome segregation protein Spo0J